MTIVEPANQQMNKMPGTTEIHALFCSFNYVPQNSRSKTHKSNKTTPISLLHLPNKGIDHKSCNNYSTSNISDLYFLQKGVSVKKT